MKTQEELKDIAKQILDYEIRARNAADDAEQEECLQAIMKIACQPGLALEDILALDELIMESLSDLDTDN